MAQYQATPQELTYGRAARSAGSGDPRQSGTPLPTPTVNVPSKLSFRQRAAILIAGADAPALLFGPQQPLQPIAQDPAAGVISRPWDYPVGWNTRVKPRSDARIDFAVLKAVATEFDIVRGLMERVKDKICSKGFSIQPRDPKAAVDARCDEMEVFFAFPDKDNSWQDWLRMLMDQVLVYDAPAIWIRRDRAGRPYSLNIQDGSLFQPKIMGDGTLPAFNEGPAYQKVVKGLPAGDYIRPVPRGTPIPNDASTGYPFPELLLKPRNKRVDNPYGYGPIEQMLPSLGIAMAREAYLMQYYTSGSMPDLIFEAPDTWTTDDIASFAINWNARLAGNLEERRGTQFVPAGGKFVDVKEKALTDTTDQWLIRIMCFFLGLNPMPFVQQQNRATAQAHQQQGEEEGLVPWQNWIADTCSTVMRILFGYGDLELRWDEDDAIDPLQQAQIDALMVTNKVYTADEICAQRGDDPMPPEMRAQMDLATFSAAVNSTVLPDDQQKAQNDHALAMQAAKPAPIMAPNGGDKPPASKFDDAQFTKWIETFKQPAVNIHVDAPAINMPAMPPINIAPAAVTVNMPEIKQPDVFVDVGGTSVRVDAQRGIGKTVTATRGPDGKLVGTITDGVTKTITGTRDEAGKLIAKIE